MIQCERNLKDEKNGQRHGGKEEKEQDRKDDRRAGCPGVAAGRAVRGSGYVGGPVGAGLTAITAFADVRDPTADTSPGTGEVLVDIAGEDQLKQWYDQRLMGETA